MDNKRINVLFCLVLIFFLALTFILMRAYDTRRINDFKDLVYISKIIKEKNNKIRMLYQENIVLKQTLVQTRNQLEAISQRLGQPIAVAATIPPHAVANK